VQDEFEEFEPVPTVNSILIAGSKMKVQVSLAGKLDSVNLALIDYAEISAYTDGIFIEKLEYSGNGIYTSSFTVEQNRTYRCEISIPGYNKINCTDSIPGTIAVSNIKHIDEAGKDEEGMTYPAIEFTFRNNPDEKRYFEVALRMIVFNHERIADLKTITDPVILNEGLPIALFSNESIKDYTCTMRLNYFTGGAHSFNGGPLETDLFPLILEVRSVSLNYYKYIKQKYLYEKGRYPEFMAASATAFPLYSNVQGGYGIFAGYCSVQSDTIFPENYLRP